jgi:hypothetical protein
MNAEDYSIVVGIDTYPQLRVLRSSMRDATLFAEWLQSPDGGDLPKDNVRLLLSKPTLPADPWDAVPVQRDIDRALRDFGAAERKRIGRRLYFYFAGHGIGPTFDDVGLLMADASMETLRSNIGLRPYLVYLHDTVLFDEVIFILDCCRDNVRSEQTNGPAFGGAKGTAAAAAGEGDAPMNPVESFVVLAAEYGAEAFAPTSVAGGERRGVLTQAVLEALKGTAAADASGRITAFSLREYVLRRVPEIATDERLKQAPRIDRVPSRDIVFRTVPAAQLPRVRVRIMAPAGLGGELIVRQGNGSLEVDRRKAANAVEATAPWELDLLLNSRYEVEHTASDTITVLDPQKVQNTHVYRFPNP